jgi:SAM-dependent methyltransferase
MGARRFRRRAALAFGSLLTLSALVTAFNFPYDTDPQADLARSGPSKAFYNETYKAIGEKSSGVASVAVSDDNEDVYAKTARVAAASAHVSDRVAEFVDTHGLRGKRVLDVGSGNGLLQDIVDDYTGLDISGTVRRYYHKPFVEASATDMPFRDDEFDGLWSIWVLEHIPNPERALTEMRRVAKDGAYIFLWPAWDCPTWLAEGYGVRPFSDFDLRGKLTKASLAIRTTRAYRLLYRRQVQAIRWGAVQLAGRPSRLHFIRLEPNYDQFWQPDSDAAISVSYHEVKLWFESRGDECTNCPTELQMAGWTRAPDQMIVRVHKRMP